MTRFLMSVVFAALATASASAQGDDSTSLDDIPHITIVGTAHTDMAPDLATISLGVVMEKPTATAAAEATARLAQSVVAAAKAAGVTAADIQTQGLSLTQTFDDLHDSAGRYTGRKPRGFEAANTIAVRIRNLAQAGTLAQSLIEAGANRFDGIAFSVEHPQPIITRLTGEAVKDARAQAEIAAQAAGAKLGRVLLIERPSGNRPSPAIPFAAMRAKVAAAPAPAEQPIEAGTTEASTTMEVTWALDQ